VIEEMERLRKLLGGGGDASAQEAAPAPASPPPPPGAPPVGGRLNAPLTERDRHAVPGSFFVREEWFRRKSATAGAAAAPPAPDAAPPAVEPRASGLCQVRLSLFGGWAPAWVALDVDAHALRLTPLDAAAAAAAASGRPPPPPPPPPPPDAPPARALELIGARLAAGRDPRNFSIAGAGGSVSGGVVRLRAPSAHQRLEWLAALARVPGLQRRVGDYFDVGALWGRGATCDVREAVSRLDGRRLALKSRLHATADATRAMHNELRILQLCALHP
jgi:hypothetical protein